MRIRVKFGLQCGSQVGLSTASMVAPPVFAHMGFKWVLTVVRGFIQSAHMGFTCGAHVNETMWDRQGYPPGLSAARNRCTKVLLSPLPGVKPH